MKRIIFLLLLAFEFKADLVLEITESASKPIKIAILEKLLCNNLINTKEIILNKSYYLKDLFSIINKKNR